MGVASPAPRAAASFDSELDLAGLGATLWRKKWTILRPTILVGLVTLLVVQVITPRYQSESRVIIESRDSNVYLRPEADRDNNNEAVDEEAVTSQAQIILSRDLAREVIDKLKLGERPEFDPALSGVSPIKAVLGLLGLVKDPLSMTPEERVLEAYYDRLTVTPVANSRVIDIDFLSQDPELAAQVANAIADGYLVFQQGARREQARSAGQWLAGEIENLRKKVADAESRVEDFRSKSSLFVGTNNTTLSNQQMGELNTQLNNARALKSDAESKARLIREMLQTGKPIESADVLNSELIRRLSEQRVTLRAQLAEQSSTLLDNHPRIKELKAQLTDLDRQIRDEASKLSRSLDNDARIAGGRVESLNASLDQLKKLASSANGQDVQLRALEREAKAIDQSRSAVGLGQETNCSPLQSSGASGLVGEGGDEYERHGVTLGARHRQELQSAHARHPHVGDHARRVIQAARPQEVLGGRICLDRVPVRPQKLAGRGTN